jgi:sodium pump decarboxylase gamma subunit
MEQVLTSAEKTNIGLMTTGLGLLVTFAVLILIIVILTVLAGVLRERKKSPSKAATAPKPAMATPPAAAAAQADDGELVAALTAAVAAYLGSPGSAAGLVVRSYRRLDRKNAWAEAGKNAQIFNKF